MFTLDTTPGAPNPGAALLALGKTTSDQSQRAGGGNELLTEEERARQGAAAHHAQRVREIRARWEATAGGIWRALFDAEGDADAITNGMERIGIAFATCEQRANMKFMAGAHQDVPYLLACLNVSQEWNRRQAAIIEQLAARAALASTADTDGREGKREAVIRAAVVWGEMDAERAKFGGALVSWDEAIEAEAGLRVAVAALTTGAGEGEGQ